MSARDFQILPGTVGISFLSVFLPGNSSPGRFKVTVPFAFSEKAKLRSQDQAVCQKYHLRLIRDQCLPECGTGHTHARIYEWLAASVRRVSGFFYASVWVRSGTRSSQLQRNTGSPAAFQPPAGRCRTRSPPRGPALCRAGEGEPRTTPAAGEPAQRLC